MSPPAVELLAVGDELLLGHGTDSNGAWLARRLADEGIAVAHRATVGDDERAIAGAVAAALERTGVVLCTGGLGPTQDDVTKPAVATLFGRSLELDEALLASIRDRFRRRGLRMADRNRAQAEVPVGAVVLPNRRGTAPGLWLEDDAGVAVLLPGVPHEMRELFDEAVLPRLRDRWTERGRPVRSRVVRTTQIAESTLAERLEDVVKSAAPLRLAFLPSFDGTDIRLTSWGDLDEDAVEAAFDAAEAEIRARVGRHVYGRDADTLAGVVGEALARRGLRLAVAESCTGGLVTVWLTDVPGASRHLIAGVVAYADEAKRELLAVDGEVLRYHGAVSEEVVRAMVHGARAGTGADAGIAVTGIAGPDGGTPEKPVGTVWVAAAVGERVQARRLALGGDRNEIRHRSAQAALALLRGLLEGEPS